MGKTLVEHFAVIEDPRRGRVAHDLTEMLVIVTCAMFSEVETFVDITEWARHKEAWLRRFLHLEYRISTDKLAATYMAFVRVVSAVISYRYICEHTA